MLCNGAPPFIKKPFTDGLHFWLILSILLWGLHDFAMAASPTINTEQPTTNLRFPVQQLQIRSYSDDTQPDIDLKTLFSIAQQERLKYPPQMTLDELHQIGDALTLYVRAQGYVFHTVFLPPQKIQQGIVYFSYQQAELRDIHVINHSSLSDARFKNAFRSLVNKPLYGPALDNKVHALKAQTGLKIFAFYSRAGAPNSIRLNLRVTTYPLTHITLRAENYGSDAAGKYRAIAEAQLYQLLSGFDQLSVAALQSVDGADTVFGYIHYRHQFTELDDSLSLSAGNSEFTLGNQYAALDMSGSSRSLRAEWNHTFDHHSVKRKSLQVGAYQLESETLSGFDVSLTNHETSTGFSLGYSGNHEPQTWRLFYNITAQHGDFESERIANGESQSLDKTNYSIGYLQHFSSNKRLANDVFLNLRGQHSREQLPSIESVNLGGISGVRAIEPNKYSADSGLLTTLEWRFPQLLQVARAPQVKLTPYLFFDTAKGDSLAEINTNKTRTQLSGWGTGLQLRWKSVSANLTYAQPVTEKLKGSTFVEEFNSDAQWLFELRWQ